MSAPEPLSAEECGGEVPTREQYEEDWPRCEGCGRYVHPETPGDGDGCVVCAECAAEGGAS